MPTTKLRTRVSRRTTVALATLSAAAELQPEELDISVQEQQDLFDVRQHDDEIADVRGGQVA